MPRFLMKELTRGHTQSVDGDQHKRKISLPTTQKVFDLYQIQRIAFNPDDVIKLYPTIIQFIRKPSHREIIWIESARGDH